jgi:cytochrome c-type biogenesis protein CcmH/NrfF
MTKGSVLASRTAWLLLAVVAIALLAIGSVHGGGSSAQARTAQLDSIIKCPACEDLSIAQSDAPSSMALRHRVYQFVGEGWSNARIESWVTGRYGSDALLVPASSGMGETLYVVPLAAIGLAVGCLGWYLWRRRSAPPATGDVAGGTEAGRLPVSPEHPLTGYLRRDRHSPGSAER